MFMLKRFRVPLFLWLAFILLGPAFLGAETKTSVSFLEILVSPRSVIPGQSFKVLVTAEEQITPASLMISGPKGSLPAIRVKTGGGRPYWWLGEYQAIYAGEHQIVFRGNNKILGARDFIVSQSPQLRSPSRFIWASEKEWDRGMENLFSAWLELLFLESEEGATWKHLHEVTRDAEKNMLHNYLGLEEDAVNRRYPLVIEPDCADNPFILRAYFAWKLGLPYGHHRCDFGYGIRAPQCAEWSDNLSLRQVETSDMRAFQRFVHVIRNTIHSGSARTQLASDQTDLYPVPLQRHQLRPGVVYADPYGHTLTLVRWIPQTEHESGQLLAVDAQPDGTIAVKRFWQGNFLFATQNVRGEPGFKAFRPIVRKNDTFRLLNNQEIAEHPGYGNYSLEQHGLAREDFYDILDRLINPRPLDPAQALEELFKAVYDRLLARVIAVENGENYMREAGYAVVPMPSGAGIFQTIGPWENFSTPSRDMRLLIALDVLLDFPERVKRKPDAFQIPAGKSTEIQMELEGLFRTRSQEMTISYTQSDGIDQVLTLAEILQRLEALEMAYNPNDCVEIRWGAREGSEEFSACSRRAPLAQRQKMAAYRSWFKNRIIPVR